MYTDATKICHGSQLIADFERLLEDEEFSDVVFVVDGDRRFHAHRPILATRSECFRRIFQARMRESSEKEIRLKKTPAEAFKALLRYLYTEKVDLTSMERDTVVDLFQTADKYLCDDLKKEIEDYLKNSFNLENIAFFLKALFIHCNPSFLEECLQFIDRNALEFLETTDFDSLDGDTWVLILQRESFYAKKKEIFDAVIKRIKANSHWKIFTVKLVCEILEASFVQNMPSFLEECLLFVDQNAEAFLEYDEFTSLSADVLNLIFQRDSFGAEEERIFDAVVGWIEANSGLSKEEHKRILDCVRIGQVPLEKVRKFAEKSGLLTEKEIKRASPRWTVPTENVATYENGAKVIAGSWLGGSIDAFLDGKTEIFTASNRSCYHAINQPGESITIELVRPYLIGSVRFLLWDLDQRWYSYYVETSLDGANWTRVVDKTTELCKSWQDLTFTSRPLKFIKLVGTRISNFSFFNVFHFECPSKNQ